MVFQNDRDFDVIPLGRIAVDFNPSDIHRPLSESRTFIKYVGGSPANIAVGMARLGKKVGFIAKVSDDEMGKFVTSFFISLGIDVSNISKANNGETIGLTFTEIKSETESSILMYRSNAADLSLEPEDVNEDYVKRAKILLISGTSLACSPSREAAFAAVFYAKKNGVKIVFDVDFRNYTWKNKSEISIYYSLLAQMSDIIIGSREEFTLMEGMIDPGNTDDAKTAKRCFDFGNEIVIIKHGKDGSVAYVNDGGIYPVKPFKANLLKSFGGGDGYASAFLYALLEGIKIEEALQYASASAAMLVSAHSCSEAMPTLAELKEFIQKGTI